MPGSSHYLLVLYCFEMCPRSVLVTSHNNVIPFVFRPSSVILVPALLISIIVFSSL